MNTDEIISRWNRKHESDPYKIVWKMEQIDEYFRGCEPHDIVDALAENTDFHTYDKYFFESFEDGLVSFNDLFSVVKLNQIENETTYEQKETGHKATIELIAFHDKKPEFAYRLMVYDKNGVLFFCDCHTTKEDAKAQLENFGFQAWTEI